MARSLSAEPGEGPVGPRLSALLGGPTRERMTQPGADPTHDRSHQHIDLGALMDGSERGPEEEGAEGKRGGPQRSWGGPSGAGAYGEAAELSGETSDGYVSGQDEGSID